ncbi:MAG: hypothetical protein J5J06_05580 [Phycisphaerae bacterium]|nr:hypothetical protein [Phycisphaerae bacterium]
MGNRQQQEGTKARRHARQAGFVGGTKQSAECVKGGQWEYVFCGGLEIGRELGAEKLVEVMLLPDGLVASMRGEMLLDATAWREIEKQFAELSARGPVVFDYEHQSLGRLDEDEDFSSPDGTAPAAGWIHALRYETGRGLMARVEWNERARTLIRDGEYRYVSPVTVVRKSDRRVVGILSAALTNTPAIRRPMERLAAKQQPRKETRAMAEEPMGADPMLKVGQILSKLGIEASEVSDINSALDAILSKLGSGVEGEEAKAEQETANSARKALGLKADAGADAVALAIKQLKDVSSGSNAEVKALRDKVTALETESRDRQARDLVDKYVKERKLNPNDRERMEKALKLARENPTQFEEVMALTDSFPAPPRGQTQPPAGGAPGGKAKEDELIAKALKEHKNDHAEAMTALQVELRRPFLEQGFTSAKANEICREQYPKIFSL